MMNINKCTTLWQPLIIAEATMVVLACATVDTPAAAPARIEVRPAEEIGPVNRQILGAAICAAKARRHEGVYADRGSGVWDPEHRRPDPEFVALAKQAGISAWRWAPGTEAKWKPFVGPLSERPYKFGLPEFLRFCEETDAVPVILLDVYRSTAADAADLVEYLNSPDNGKNPNGGMDWASVRAADGHPAPYDVVWFECGNESYVNAGKWIKELGVGGYGGLAEEYARRYLRFRAAMKAVDPRIKLGANIQHTIDPWNKPILRVAGKQIDFGIDHPYSPGFTGKAAPEMSRRIMEACVARGAPLQKLYDDLDRVVEEETGRTDMPRAVTEYNALLTQQEPVPYRFTLGNALGTAEHIRVMMRPRNRIGLATFWNFANEFWGIVRGYPHRGERPVKQAPYYVFQLYHEHFGDTLIASQVSCGRWDFQGGYGVPAQSVPDLTVNTAKRTDGTITLMIVNTNVDTNIETTIVVENRQPDGDTETVARSLVGATPLSTNLGSEPHVKVIKTAIRPVASGWRITLPKHSLTAAEIRP